MTYGKCDDMRLLSNTCRAVKAAREKIIKVTTALINAVLNRKPMQARATEVEKNAAPIDAATAISKPAENRGNQATLSRYNAVAAKLMTAPTKRTPPERYRCGSVLLRITSHIAMANEIADGTRVVVTE